MVCCAIGAVLLAALAAWWRRVLPRVPMALAVIAVAGGIGTAAVLAAGHLDHHGAGELPMLAAAGELPICRGSPSAARAADADAAELLAQIR